MTDRLASMIAFAILSAVPVAAEARSVGFEEYERRSMQVVPEHPVASAACPFIAVHSHQRGSMSEEELRTLVADMEDPRPRPTQGGASEDPFRERAPNHPGDRTESIPDLSRHRIPHGLSGA